MMRHRREEEGMDEPFEKELLSLNRTNAALRSERDALEKQVREWNAVGTSRMSESGMSIGDVARERDAILAKMDREKLAKVIHDSNKWSFHAGNPDYSIADAIIRYLREG